MPSRGCASTRTNAATRRGRASSGRSSARRSPTEGRRWRARARAATRSPATARRRLRLATRLASAGHDDDLLSLALGGLGMLEMRRGQTALAKEMLTIADERARKAGRPATRVRAFANLAQ